MWKRSFVATTVAIGGTVDDALSACDARPEDPALGDLVVGLRADRRAVRAAALATSVRDIVVAIDEATLR